MLSRNEAVSFIENFLKLDNVEKRLKEDRVQFLNDYIRSHYTHIPYQNFRILSYEYKNRVALPSSVYMKDCLNGLGGTCHPLNSFVNAVLRAIGFDATLQSSTVNFIPDAPNQHLVNLVRGVNHPDDLYLVDPAGWCPTFQAIPLHEIKEDAPLCYKFSYQELKFSREGTRFQRWHRRSKIQLLATSDEPTDNWFPFYHFDLQPRTVQQIEDTLTGTYRDRTNGAVKGLSFSMYPKGKAIALKNFRLFVYDELTDSVTVTKLESTEEIANNLSQYCTITHELIDKANANLVIEKAQKKMEGSNDTVTFLPK